MKPSCCVAYTWQVIGSLELSGDILELTTHSSRVTASNLSRQPRRRDARDARYMLVRPNDVLHLFRNRRRIHQIPASLHSTSIPLNFWILFSIFNEVKLWQTTRNCLFHRTFSTNHKLLSTMFVLSFQFIAGCGICWNCIYSDVIKFDET